MYHLFLWNNLNYYIITNLFLCTMKKIHNECLTKQMNQMEEDLTHFIFRNMLTGCNLFELKEVRDNPYLLIMYIDDDIKIVPIKNEPELELVITNLALNQSFHNSFFQGIKVGNLLSLVNGPVFNPSSMFFFLRTDKLTDYTN